LIPTPIRERTKQPYRAPDASSFVGAGELDYVRNCLSEASIAAGGLFNAKAVANLHEKCRAQPVSGFRDNAAFVGILSTQLWQRNFTGQEVGAARAA
ncbi:MAG: asparagine synthetase B, partial [Mesorhizobium sp.]